MGPLHFLFLWRLSHLHKRSNFRFVFGLHNIQLIEVHLQTFFGLLHIAVSKITHNWLNSLNLNNQVLNLYSRMIKFQGFSYLKALGPDTN